MLFYNGQHLNTLNASLRLFFRYV